MPTQLGQDSLVALIELAYEAAQDGAKWPVYLQQLADAIGGRGALLIHHDLARGGAVVHSARLDPASLAAYNDHYHAVDVWALSTGARTMTAASNVLPDHGLVPRRSLRQSEFYSDFLCRFGQTRMVVVALDPPNQASPAFRGITIFRSEADPEFDIAEVAFLQAAAPSLRRALSVYDRLVGAEVQGKALLDVMETLGRPVLIVDGWAEVRWASSSARRMRCLMDGLEVKKGRLVAGTTDDTRRLRQGCADIARERAIPAVPCPLVMPRAAVGIPVEILLAPTPPATSTIPAGSARDVLVFVHDPLVERPPSRALLQSYYGLTRVEAEVGSGLVSGRTLDEIAAARGTSLETVRWHVKHVLAKTGCGSRAELARRVTLGLAGIFTEGPPTKGSA